MNEGPQRYNCNKKPQRLIKPICMRNKQLGDQKCHWGGKNDLKSHHHQKLHS